MLIYITGPTYNFGDLLNYTIFDHFFNAVYLGVNEIRFDERFQFVGLGTLIDFIAPAEKFTKTKLVFLGTGANDFDKKVDLSWQKGWVRGALSAEKTGLPYIGDVGLLLDGLIGDVQKRDEVCLILDWTNDRGDIGVFDMPVLEYHVEPITKYDVPDICHKVKSSKYVITDRLHIAILAESLEIPWLIYQHGHFFTTGYKFNDWAMTVNKERFIVPDLSQKSLEIIKENDDFIMAGKQKQKLREALEGVKVWLNR